MKNSAFYFYSVLKNEDAIPYVGGNLLVAADGLGGSGSAVHRIERQRHPNMRMDVLSGIFGDIQHISPELLSYIEELIAPMIDGKDDTSALWASRIAIARCVYALTQSEFKDADLSDAGIRERLAEFIAKGLKMTAAKFDLKLGELDGRLLLPTTLAFIRYTEHENSVTAETVWAGDSRLYALTPAGLKLLSADDEDESGMITNLFFADNEKVRLNYLRHDIAKPCVLMAVSDGVFDPFLPHEHLGVEYAVLTEIERNSSAAETSEALKKFYDSIRGDDATMAFAPFGFADFADMQRVFKGRADLIAETRQKHAEMASALEVMNMSEEEATHYVYARTVDRFDHIIPLLAEAIDGAVPDIAATPEIRTCIGEICKAYSAEVDSANREDRRAALAALRCAIEADPNRALCEIFLSPEVRCKDQEFLDTYYEFRNAAKSLCEFLGRRNAQSAFAGSLEKRRTELHAEILARLVYYRGHFDGMWAEKDVSARREVKKILDVWSEIDIALQAGWESIKNIAAEMPEAERRAHAGTIGAVKTYLNDLRRRRQTVKEQDAARRNRIDRYQKAWKRLYERLVRDERLTDCVLTEDARRAYGFVAAEEVKKIAFGKRKRERIVAEMQGQKTAFAAEIVKALAAECDKTSVIDGQYNATKLALMRTFYRLKRGSKKEIQAFEAQLAALEDGYLSLLGENSGRRG